MAHITFNSLEINEWTVKSDGPNQSQQVHPTPSQKQGGVSAQLAKESPPQGGAPLFLPTFDWKLEGAAVI